MITITWFDGNDSHAACADAKSAWEVYWAIAQSMKGIGRTTPPTPWIAMYENGTALDPTRGGHLPIRVGDARIFVEEIA